MREQKYLDFNDPAALTSLFKANPNKLSLDENYFLKQIRFRFSKQGNNELIDFSSTTLPQVRDGNTLYNGKFVRRGLPMFDETLQVPAKQNFELVSYLKTNGDCCMFTYLEKQKTYLIATRNVSVLVQNIAQANKIENATHKIIAKIWFQYLNSKEKAFVKSLQTDLIGHTWIAELLTSENLMYYQQEQLLFHSIVENYSGIVKADAIESFKKYGFSCVPYKSYGQMDSLSLINKIESLKKETESMQISQTHEGIVLQLVDKEVNRVHSSMKVKCLEYLLFSTMTEIILNSIERGEIDTQFEKNNQAFLKQFKDVIKVNKVLPNDEQCYLDIFNTALTLVSQRQNPNDFNQNRTQLFSERASFYSKVISLYQEKKKKSLSIDFNNSIDFPQEEPTFFIDEQIITKSQTRIRNKPKLIVVACPPFCLSIYCFEMLQEMFNLHTIDYIDQFELPKRSPDANKPKRSNLLLIQNLDGIQEQTKYQIKSLWVYKVTIQSNKDLVKNSISEEQSFYSFSEYNLSSSKLRNEILDFKNQCDQLEMDVLMFDSEEQLLNSLNQQLEEQKLDFDYDRNNKREVSSSSKSQKQREPKLKIDKKLSNILELLDDEKTESQIVKTNKKSNLRQKNLTNGQKIAQSIIFVLLPLGLPGMGHLDFYQSEVEQSIQDIYPDLNIQIVSDRDIRQELTSKYLDKNKKKTWIQSVKATERKVQAEFSQLLQRQIKECSESQRISAIYLDKCFTPNSIQQILQSPLFANTESTVIKGVILVPDLPKKQTIYSNHLSKQYLLKSFCKQLNLIDHYQGETTQSLLYRQFQLYQLFEGFDISSLNEDMIFIDYIGSESQLPEDLDNLMSEAIEMSLDPQIKEEEDFYYIIDEIAQKIQMYRSLFGATDFSAPFQKNTSPYTKKFKLIFDKVIQEHENKQNTRNQTKLNRQQPNENKKNNSQTRSVNQNKREQQYFSEDQYSDQDDDYKRQPKRKQKQQIQKVVPQSRQNQKQRSQNLFDDDQSSISSRENGRSLNQKQKSKQDKQVPLPKRQRTNDNDQRLSISQSRLSTKQTNQYPDSIKIEQQRSKQQKNSPKRINQQNSINNFKEQDNKKQVRSKSLLKTPNYSEQVSSQREYSNSVEKQKKSVSFQQESIKQDQRTKAETGDQTEKDQLVQQKIVKKYVARASSINSERKEKIMEDPEFDVKQDQINLLKVDAEKFYPTSSTEEKDLDIFHNTKKFDPRVNDEEIQVSQTTNNQTTFQQNDKQGDLHLNRVDESEVKVDNNSQLDFDLENQDDIQKEQSQQKILSKENNLLEQRQDQPFKENPFARKLITLGKESSEGNDDDIGPWQEKTIAVQQQIHIQNQSNNQNNFELDESLSSLQEQQVLQSEKINSLELINSTDLVNESNQLEAQLIETSSLIDKQPIQIDNTNSPDLFILQPIISQTEINQLLTASILKSDSKILKEMNEGEQKIFCDIKSLLQNQDGKLMELNGWQLNLEYRIVVEYIGRDEYRLQESRTWQDGFNSGTKVKTDIVGIIIIPNQMIICVGLPIKDTIKVPCMVIACNRQFTDQVSSSKIISETINLCEQTVQWRGSAFRDQIIEASQEKVVEKMVSRSQIKISSTSKTVNVFYIALENQVCLQYITQIIY